MLMNEDGRYKIVLCKDTFNKRIIIFESAINKSDISELIHKYKQDN